MTEVKPKRQQHPTLTDWQYEEHGSGGWTILHGFRDDQPAALPLIATSGRTRTASFQQFSMRAREWDQHAGLKHNVKRPANVR